MAEEKKQKETVRRAKQKLLDRMADIDPTSEEYDKLSTQLQKLTQAEQNDKGWKTQLGGTILQSLISSASSVATVLGVLRHEDRGNIVTTKSLQYAEKPHMGQLRYDRNPEIRNEPKKKG